MGKKTKSIDPCFNGRNVAVLQYTQCVVMDEWTRRKMSNAAIPKRGRVEEEWAKLDLALTAMRSKTDLQEAVLIVMNVRPELEISRKLLTSTALALFGCEAILMKHGEREDRSAGNLVVPKLPIETMNDEQGPSGSGKNEERHNEEREERQTEEPMEQNPDQVVRDDDETSVSGAFSRDFNFLDEDKEGTGTSAGTTELAQDETSTLEIPSAFMNAAYNLPESSSPGENEITAKKLLTESPRRKKKKTQPE